MFQIQNREDFIEWVLQTDEIQFDEESEQVDFSTQSPNVVLEIFVAADDASIDVVSDSLTKHFASPNTSVSDPQSFKNEYRNQIKEVRDESNEIEMKNITSFSPMEVAEICKTVHTVDSLYYGSYDVRYNGTGGWSLVEYHR